MAKRTKINIFHGAVTVIPDAANPDAPNLNGPKKLLVDSRHPEHSILSPYWTEWRLTYQAGRNFIDRYLEQFTTRESQPDFLKRKKLTPVPAFAKAAINDIKNSIFQRMTDTTRQDGPVNYQQAIQGNNGGVDRRGGSMNWFIGDQILPELLTMKKVGVFVDSPPLKANETQASRLEVHPYLYIYLAEDILNWSWKEDGSQMEFRSVLLRDRKETVDPITKLPLGITTAFRLMWIGDDGFVHIQFFSEKDEKLGRQIDLKIRKIPFIVFEISDSLLADASSYQIALLNLRSSDIAFALNANFPFYIEQTNPTTEQLFAKQPTPVSRELVPLQGDPTTLTPFDPTAACFPTEANKSPEITVGTMQGRRYPAGLNAPAFIAPPTESLKASLMLQDALKEEIRLLVNLALSSIKPQQASAESKAMDQVGLESGLSYIGLELEHGERQIAVIWALYESSSPATVKYPERYSLKTDEQQQKEASELKKQILTAPSKSYQREMVKRIAIILLGTKVSAEMLQKILSEIDNAPASTADPDIISQHIADGMLTGETASQISGYISGEATKAALEQITKLSRIADAQGVNDPAKNQARGLPDAGANGNASIQEKQGKPVRAEAQ